MPAFTMCRLLSGTHSLEALLLRIPRICNTSFTTTRLLITLEFFHEYMEPVPYPYKLNTNGEAPETIGEIFMNVYLYKTIG